MQLHIYIFTSHPHIRQEKYHGLCECVSRDGLGSDSPIYIRTIEKQWKWMASPSGEGLRQNSPQG